MLGFAKWKALEGELLEGTYLYLLFQKQSFAKAQDVLPARDYELHCTPVVAYLASVQEQQLKWLPHTGVSLTLGNDS